MNKDQITDRNVHIGTVVSIKGNEALITFQRSSMCNHCMACGIKDEKTMETYVMNDMAAHVGDSVVVEMDNKTILKASLIAYIIPLLAFLAGLIVGFQFGEIAAIILPIVFCIVSLLLLYFIDKRLKTKPIYRPHITKILNSGNK